MCLLFADVEDSVCAIPWVALAVVILLVICLAKFVHRYYKKPAGHAIELKLGEEASRTKVRFVIDDQRFGILDKVERVTSTMGNSASNPDADVNAAPSKDCPDRDGKVHIVWSFDMPDVQRKLGTIAPISPPDEAEEAAADIQSLFPLPEHLANGDALDEPCSDGDPGDQPALGQLPDPPPEEVAVNMLDTAFADGEAVEYFSTTHNRWIAGTVHVEVSPDRPGQPPRAIYHVETNRRRKLLDSVQMLRPLLREGEPCAVKSTAGTQPGKWLDAVVFGEQKDACTTLGYQVMLLMGANPVISGVPPARVQRRFPSGMPVEVYREEGMRWVSAVIATDAKEEHVLGLTDIVPEERDGLGSNA